METAEAKK